MDSYLKLMSLAELASPFTVNIVRGHVHCHVYFFYSIRVYSLESSRDFEDQAPKLTLSIILCCLCLSVRKQGARGQG